MTGPIEPEPERDTVTGFSVLDGVALVTGAAVASVHVRGVIRDGLSGFGWVVAWGAFSWVAVTAAGPFVFLVRRFVRRVAGHPRVGDWLWALLGLPWLVSALLRTDGEPSNAARNELFATSLSVGLAIAALIALVVLWRNWVMVPPEQAARMASTPWTNRVGLALSVAWPVQCGLGMVVTG